MKKKIVFIAPHLSTGGMPQYLVKQIESIKDEMDVYCVEWGDVTGGVLVVQRNKMINLLGEKLYTLGENKHELFSILDRLKPDVIHLQEIPELFMERDVADKLYSTNRDYVLIETSHDSGYDPNQNKTYLPDKFLMVSQYQANLYKDIDVPCDVVEYPIENKVRTKTREQALRDLGLDPNLKHVINVGLFTPRKNQAEVIEYARLLKDHPIQFHFLGNQADNFRFYWEPLMQEFPSNCKWWNERSDVDAFYEAADLFLFTSRGSTTDHETMPLVIREALSWKTPSLIYNLPVYMGYFDKYETIEYLTTDIQHNANRIAEKLIGSANMITDKPEIFIVSSYPNNELKEEMLNDTVTKLKEIGKTVLLVSHYPVPDYIVKKADYFLYDSYNMLDGGHTLEHKEPDYWMQMHNFRIESITANHTSALSRMFSLALDFVKMLGYEYFVVLESDSKFDINDLRKFDTIKQKLQYQNKKLFFCKPKFTEFNWNNSQVYETYAFGGNLDEFLRVLKFPKTKEEWKNMVTLMGGNFCFESIIYKHFHPHEDDYLILGTLKSEFLRSKIDLFSNSNHSGIYYNLNEELKPVIFLMVQDEENVRYNVMINHNLRILPMGKESWYFDIIDLTTEDNINVRVEKWVGEQLVSVNSELLSRQNIIEKKKYKTIKFN